jgi:hypothetical protein
MDVSPTSGKSCLGRERRDHGHSRVPLPPARMRAWRREVGIGGSRERGRRG